MFDKYKVANGPFSGLDDIFVDSLYYVYVVPTRGHPYNVWEIYKLEKEHTF